MDESPVMEWIDVSAEMVSFVGRGSIAPVRGPEDPVAFVITFGAVGAPATLRFLNNPTRQTLDADREMRIVLLVARAACRRILAREIWLADESHYHLPSALRAIAVAIRDCDMLEAGRTPYRLAKSIELLCDTLQALARGELIPLSPEGYHSGADTLRLLTARRIIDERWAEKLTLDMIARAAGLNRAKLTRGFREMFDCSVADAIAGQRLSEAGNMLLATDLPISSIGYKCGYLNNASFTRAFARHFGVAPTQYRAQKLAA